MNEFRIFKREKWFLWAIFFCALLIRLFYFHVFLQENPCMLAFDSGHYHELATQVVDGQGFTKLDGAPQFYRLPGYSIFLAACYKIFDFNVLATLLVQILLASLIPILIFCLALQLFPDDIRAAKIAAVIGCLHHGLVIFSGLVMTETLFMLFFLLFLLLFFKVPVRFLTMLSAGILLGCASLIRSVGLPLLFVSLLVILFFKISWRQKRVAMIALSIGWLLVIGLWLARNYMLTGAIFLDTLSGAHLLNHQAIPVMMKAENITHTQAKKRVYALFDEQKREQEAYLQRPLRDIEASHVAGSVTIHICKRYMFSTVVLKHNFFNIFKTCFSLYAAELLVIDSGGKLPEYDNNRSLGMMIKRFLVPETRNGWIRVMIYGELAMMLFLLIGFFGYIVVEQKDLLWRICYQILPFIILFIGLSFACGFARLRLPPSPFFIIVASRFWSLVMERKKVMCERSK